MKNRLFCILLAFTFLIGNSLYANVGNFDGGIELPIMVGKIAAPITTITIPQKYLGKNGGLLTPIQIIIKGENGSTEGTLLFYSNKIQLPNYLSGKYILEFSIDDFYTTRKLTL